MIDLLWPNFSCILIFMLFVTSPIKRWKLFPKLSNLGWPYDLIWPRECGRSSWVSVLNLDLNRPWVVLLSLLETFHRYVKYPMLENDEKSYELGPISPSWGHPKARPPNKIENPIKMKRATYSIQCWLQVQVKHQSRPENSPSWSVDLQVMVVLLVLWYRELGWSAIQW